MFPQNWLYRGAQNRRFFAFSRTSKNVVEMCILRIASWTLSQNTRDLLKNLSVAKNEFRKLRKLHSRSYSRPLLESACSHESDFYEFPLSSRKSTQKYVKSIEDYRVFRVPEDPTNPKFVENVVFNRLISTSLFRDVAAEARGGQMVENSKEKLDFTEFRLLGRTEKDYTCRRILTVFEKVASFLEFLLIHLPISWKLRVFSQKTYTRKGIVISRRRVLLDNHSSFDTPGANVSWIRKMWRNLMNFVEKSWLFIKTLENTSKSGTKNAENQKTSGQLMKNTCLVKSLKNT